MALTSNSAVSDPESLVANEEEEEEEYTPVLSYRQHTEDSEEDTEDTLEDSGPARKKRRTQEIQLPPPPNFEPLIHQTPAHQAF
ncbi:hypothetical protein BGX20_006910, partial [Mortierella sp. AD010]